MSLHIAFRVSGWIRSPRCPQEFSEIEVDELADYSRYKTNRGNGLLKIQNLHRFWGFRWTRWDWVSCGCASDSSSPGGHGLWGTGSTGAEEHACQTTALRNAIRTSTTLDVHDQQWECPRSHCRSRSCTHRGRPTRGGIPHLRKSALRLRFQKDVLIWVLRVPQIRDEWLSIPFIEASVRIRKHLPKKVCAL